ncbi:MAG: hypothetical protein PHW75_03540 [Patescibacteria group bacterium]|nr:hypothetical protein [Patescibacteria group bacterium]
MDILILAGSVVTLAKTAVLGMILVVLAAGVKELRNINKSLAKIAKVQERG